MRFWKLIDEFSAGHELELKLPCVASKDTAVFWVLEISGMEDGCDSSCDGLGG